jgi:hypothetical protein
MTFFSLQDVILAEPDFTEIARFLAKLPENINADLLFKEIEVSFITNFIIIFIEKNKKAQA